MPTPSETLKDPQFQSLSGAAKRIVMEKRHPEFAGLSEAAKAIAIGENGKPDETPAPKEPKTVGGFVGNAAASSANLLKGVGQAVAGIAQVPGDIYGVATGQKRAEDTGVVRALETIGSVPIGAYEKLTGHVPDWDKKNPSSNTIDAIFGHVADRYGSLEKAKETMYTDPAGFLADLSTVAGGVSGLARGAGAGAGSVASMAGKVAAATDPIGLAVKGVKAGVKASGIAPRMYQSALKPGATGSHADPRLAAKKASDAVNTALNENIPVSEAGIDKLRGKVDSLNSQISGEINRASGVINATGPTGPVNARIVSGAGSGITIDPRKVVQRTDSVKRKFATQVNPNADLKAIRASEKEFLRGPGSAPMLADEAQAVKQGTYAQIRKSYGKLSSAQIETQKALARGIKEELAAAIPELASLNAAESKLLNLEPFIENRVRVMMNHDMMGIGTPIAAGTAAAVTGSGMMGLAAGVMKAAMDNPTWKSHAALLANRYANSGTSRIPLILSRIAEYGQPMPEPQPRDAMPPAPRQ